MTPLWDRARERFFQTDLKIWSDRAASGTGENIGSTAWNMEEDDQYEYASNCGVVWTPASTTPSEIAFLPTVTLGSLEDALFTRGATLTMDWDPRRHSPFRLLQHQTRRCHRHSECYVGADR